MRTTQLLTAAGVLALGACAPAISVRTALSPDASLTGLHTFRVLPTPKPKIAGAVSSTNDPMLVNSISNRDRKSTRLNSSHGYISYAVFCLKKKKKEKKQSSAGYTDN